MAESLVGWLADAPAELPSVMSIHLLTKCPTSWLVCLPTMLLSCISSYVNFLDVSRSIRSLYIFFTFKDRLPVKWMPPEPLFFGEASTMRDV